MKKRILISTVGIFFITLLISYIKLQEFRQYYKEHSLYNENGLRANYYTSDNWKGKPVLSGITKTLGFNNPEDLELGGRIPKEYFSIIWYGLIRIPCTGRYKFSLSSDDGSLLFIDGDLIINNSGEHNLKRVSSYKYLCKGLYPIEIRYNQYTGDAGFCISWRPPKEYKWLKGQIPVDYFHPVNNDFNPYIAHRLMWNKKRWQLVAWMGFLVMFLGFLNLKKGFIERFFSFLYFWIKSNFPAVLILCIGVVARALFVGEVPGVQADETWNAVTAYSFLEGGRHSLLRGVVCYISPLWLMQIPVYILFGFNPVSLRFYPVFFNTLALLGCYLLVKKVYDRKIALLSILVLTFWPITFMFGRISFEVTTFSLFILFYTLYLFHIGRPIHYILAGGLLGFGVFNHLFLISVPIAIFGVAMLEKKGTLLFKRDFWFVLLPLLIIGAVRFYDIKIIGGRMHDPLGVKEMLRIFGYSFGELKQVLDGATLYKLFTGDVLVKILPVNFIILIAGIVMLFVKKDFVDKPLIRLCLLTVFIYTIIFLFSPTLEPRYFFIPVTLMGVFISVILGKMYNSGIRWARVLILLTIITNIYYLGFNYFYSFLNKKWKCAFMFRKGLTFPVFVMSYKYVDTRGLYRFLIENGYYNVYTNYWIANNLLFWDIGNNLLSVADIKRFRGEKDAYVITYKPMSHLLPPSKHKEWVSSPEQLGFYELKKIKDLEYFEVYRSIY